MHYLIANALIDAGDAVAPLASTTDAMTYVMTYSIMICPLHIFNKLQFRIVELYISNPSKVVSEQNGVRAKLACH
jgi:hypothetical protein